MGSALTRELLASPGCSAVTILTRRAVETFAGVAGAGKLTQRVVDLDRLEVEAWEPAGGCEAAFCTMGVGQPKKVSREEFWRVDVEYAGAFARGCKAAGVRHMSLLTSVGANYRSRVYYLRVKGTVETAYQALGFQRLSLFRPSLLATSQVRYGYSDWLLQRVVPRVSWMFPSRYREIRVEDLGRAMRLNAEGEARGPVEILHYEEMRALLRSGERM